MCICCSEHAAAASSVDVPRCVQLQKCPLLQQRLLQQAHSWSLPSPCSRLWHSASLCAGARWVPRALTQLALPRAAYSSWPCRWLQAQPCWQWACGWPRPTWRRLSLAGGAVLRQSHLLPIRLLLLWPQPYRPRRVAACHQAEHSLLRACSSQAWRVQTAEMRSTMEAVKAMLAAAEAAKASQPEAVTLSDLREELRSLVSALSE